MKLVFTGATDFSGSALVERLPAIAFVAAAKSQRRHEQNTLQEKWLAHESVRGAASEQTLELRAP